MRYPTAPPGYLTLEGVLDALNMSKQNFYQSGIASLLDYWQVKPNTPNLYAKAQVASFRYWLFIRRGLVALGFYKGNEPLANPDYESVEAEDYYGTRCPKCGADAVYDPMADVARVWCPDCGVIKYMSPEDIKYFQEIKRGE